MSKENSEIILEAIVSAAINHGLSSNTIAPPDPFPPQPISIKKHFEKLFAVFQWESGGKNWSSIDWLKEGKQYTQSFSECNLSAGEIAAFVKICVPSVPICG